MKTVTSLCNSVCSVGPVFLARFTEIYTHEHVYVNRREVTPLYTCQDGGIMHFLGEDDRSKDIGHGNEQVTVGMPYETW